MKLKYTVSTVALGIFTLLASCNKSEHADHDHSKESAEEHSTHADQNTKDEHTDHDHASHDKDHKDEHAGHDHSAHSEGDDHDHSTCGIQIGDKGGRVLKKIDGELLLCENGKLTVYIKEDVTLDKLTALIDSEPISLIKGENNTYTADSLKDKLPATLHIAAVLKGKKSIDSFKLDLSKCGECKNPEYICTCDNHDH